MEVYPMKKIIPILAAALMISATSALAATTVTIANVKGFNKTNKVNTTAVKNTAENAWAACSAHHAGDKEYATTSAYGGLAYKTITPASTNCSSAPSAPNTPTDSAMPSNYTAM